VIVFADVLEHLRQPEEILSRCKQLLLPSGFVIASIPNIAHWSMRWNLLFGRFDYTNLGLLDRTHLRFFTYKSAFDLFEKSGYAVDCFDFVSGRFPKSMARFCPGFFAWDFIVRAYPV